MEKPKGFPERPMTVICPYGPAGGSCTFARALVQAFTEVTGVTANVEYKPGGSGLVGLKTYMSAPADGYTILEHIDDAASAYAAGQSSVHPAKDLIPLVTAQITFNQIYMRSDEKRFSDRSEEHTSELQSLMRISYAVFCLKKKKKKIQKQKINTKN